MYSFKVVIFDPVEVGKSEPAYTEIKANILPYFRSTVSEKDIKEEFKLLAMLIILLEKETGDNGQVKWIF